jgi:hypothetical protein
MIPSDLLDAVKEGKCVLFLGAGVHYPPPEGSPYVYAEKDRLVLGEKFSQQLADECIAELDEESKGDVLDPNATDVQRAEVEWKQREEQREKKREYLRKYCGALQRTSWFYQVIQHNRGVLVNKIKTAFDSGKQPSPLVRALAEIDFPVVITTNYDRLFEKALRSFQKEPAVRIYKPKAVDSTKDFPGDPTPKEPWFFKMHGCVSEPESLVIADEDYIHFVMRMGDSEDFHPVPQKLRTKFKEQPTLFVGYSLLDYNLRLLFRTLRRRVDLSEWPATFSLDPLPDLLVVATYGAPIGAGSPSPLVSFIEQDSWKFVPELYQSVTGREMPKE